MALQPGVERSGFLKAFLKWFQNIDTSSTDKGPELVNGDFIESINAAGTARIPLIGLTLGTNQLALGAIVAETAADALTAHAGGGQASALLLTAQTNRVTIVATAGDSVKLPAAVAGLELTIINSGANPMQVYGSGTDTINDVATATGVSQIQNSILIYACPIAGKWYVDGIGNGFAASLQTVSSVNTLTAHAGGGQGSATPLTAMINRITTVVTVADSVILPASAPGMELTVANAAANSANVFPATGEQINAIAANSPFALAGAKTATFYCTNTGQWHTILSA